MTVKIHLVRKILILIRIFEYKAILSIAIFSINGKSINQYFEGHMTCIPTDRQAFILVYLTRLYELVIEKSRRVEGSLK